MRQQPADSVLASPGKFRCIGDGASKLSLCYRDYRTLAEELLLLLGTVETTNRRAGADTAGSNPTMSNRARTFAGYANRAELRM